MARSTDHLELATDQYDPGFLNARREAIVILIVWAIALCWCVSVCTLFGYGVGPGGEQTAAQGAGNQQVSLFFGMPAWVFWGVLCPWITAGLFSIVFSLVVMADDDLGPDAADAPDPLFVQDPGPASSSAGDQAGAQADDSADDSAGDSTDDQSSAPDSTEPPSDGGADD